MRNIRRYFAIIREIVRTLEIATNFTRVLVFKVSFKIISKKLFKMNRFMFDNDRKFIKSKTLVLWRMRIIKSPLLQRNKFSNKK